MIAGKRPPLLRAVINFKIIIISKFVVFYSKDLLNFTYTLIKPTDGKFGRLSKDGTWNGMIRLLQDGDVDIGLLCLFFERKLALLVELQGTIFEGLLLLGGTSNSDVKRQWMMHCTDVDTGC